MSIQKLLSLLSPYISPLLILISIIVLSIINNLLFRIRNKETGTIIKPLITIAILLIGPFIFTATLPIGQALKEQILGLIGIVITATFALSSTTLIGNALAGLMNNAIKIYKLGDFIRIDNHYGRITKKGLLRTEIQTEDRNLTTLPNLYIANNPIKIVRNNGTVISTTVSLGYDIDHNNVKKLLLAAAEECGLNEPYVFFETLGDYSITYKIHGILNDINTYFSTQSLLNEKAIETLQQNNIEIVSPHFMNQRQVDEVKFIPPHIKEEKKTDDEESPENIVFDKAIKADKIEQKHETLEKIKKTITLHKKEKKEGKDKNKLNDEIKRLEKQKERIKENIEEQMDDLDE